MISYAEYDESELEHHAPVVVHVDTANRQIDASTAGRVATDQAGPGPHRYAEVTST